MMSEIAIRQRQVDRVGDRRSWAMLERHFSKKPLWKINEKRKTGKTKREEISKSS